MKKLKIDKDLKEIIFYGCIGLLAFIVLMLVTAKIASADEGDVTYSCGTYDKVVKQGLLGDQTEPVRVCDVFIPESIDTADKYPKIFQLLQYADEVNINIAGYGGLVDTAQQLIASIQDSDADITIIVRGDVYSASAMIAFAKYPKNVKVKILRNSIVMFHYSSVLELSCFDPSMGTDRGILASKKCQMYKRILMTDFNNWMINNLSYLLNEQELRWVRQGFDVPFLAKDLEKRLNGGAKITPQFTKEAIDIQK